MKSATTPAERLRARRARRNAIRRALTTMRQRLRSYGWSEAEVVEAMREHSR